MRRTAQRMASPISDPLWSDLLWSDLLWTVCSGRLDIAVLGLRRTAALLSVPLTAASCCRRLCRRLPELASRLLDSTFDLIFVDAHAISPAFAGKRPTRPSLA